MAERSHSTGALELFQQETFSFQSDRKPFSDQAPAVPRVLGVGEAPSEAVCQQHFEGAIGVLEGHGGKSRLFEEVDDLLSFEPFDRSVILFDAVQELQYLDHLEVELARLRFGSLGHDPRAVARHLRISVRRIPSERPTGF